MGRVITMQENTPRRVWQVQGRNGYWAIDELHPHEDSASYGYSLICRTRKEAELTAGALNHAYALGGRDTSEYRRQAASR
jgi:hypothetical protein